VESHKYLKNALNIFHKKTKEFNDAARNFRYLKIFWFGPDQAEKEYLRPGRKKNIFVPGRSKNIFLAGLGQTFFLTAGVRCYQWLTMVGCYPTL
jgi:hypothetical protein